MNWLNEISEALLNVLWVVSWQGSVLVGIVALVSVISRKASSSFRYALWCVVLVRLCLPLDLSFPIGLGGYVQNTVEHLLVKGATENGTALALQGGNVELPRGPMPPAGSSREPSVSSKVAGPRFSLSAKVAAAWLAIVVILGGLFVFRTIRAGGLLRSCPKLTQGVLAKLLKNLSGQIGIKREVHLRLLDAQHGSGGPVVMGLRQPTVLLPENMVRNWSSEEVEPVLLHELAHVKRHDLLVNWLQMVLQIVYFFHPLVWLANWKIRQEREQACDDFAVVHIGSKPKRYGQSILKVIEETKRDFSLVAASIGMTERRRSLAKRIIRIMDKDYRFYRGLGRLSVGLLLVLSAISIVVASGRSPQEREDVGPKIQALGEEVYRRMTTYTNQETFRLKTGEDYTMPVQENAAGVKEIVITADIASDHVTLSIRALDAGSNVVGFADTVAVWFGRVRRLTFPLRKDTGMICKVQLAPGKTEGNAVSLQVKVLLAKTPTEEQMRAMLTSRGREGLTVRALADLGERVIKYGKEHHCYPKSLLELGHVDAEDPYSPKGANLHYELNESRCILSSCGDDGVHGNDDDLLSIIHPGGGSVGHRHELSPQEMLDVFPQREWQVHNKERPFGNCSISGKVISASTEESCPGAYICLMPFETLDSIFITVASDGRYRFANIPAGRYSLYVDGAWGYQKATYKPENAESMAPALVLGEGEHKEEVNFELLPDFAIRSRVFDETRGRGSF